MKQFKITVNGVTYDVAVEETGSSAPAFAAAAPAAAPVAAPAAPAPAAAPEAAPAAPAALPEGALLPGQRLPDAADRGLQGRRRHVPSAEVLRPVELGSADELQALARGRGSSSTRGA